MHLQYITLKPQNWRREYIERSLKPDCGSKISREKQNKTFQKMLTEEYRLPWKPVDSSLKMCWSLLRESSLRCLECVGLLSLQLEGNKGDHSIMTAVMAYKTYRQRRRRCKKWSEEVMLSWETSTLFASMFDDFHFPSFLLGSFVKLR